MSETTLQVEAKAAPLPPEPIRTALLIRNRDHFPGPIFWLLLILSIPTFFGALFMAAMIMPTSIGKRTFRKGRLVVAATREFPKFIGKETKYFDVSSASARTGGIGANGIAYADGRLFIMDDGLAAEIPWARIRSWTWKIAGRETTTIHGGAGLGTSIRVQGQNANAEWQAERESGFFVTVNDVDKPEWQFKTMDENVLKRWMEILNEMKSEQLPRR